MANISTSSYDDVVTVPMGRPPAISAQLLRSCNLPPCKRQMTVVYVMKLCHDGDGGCKSEQNKSTTGAVKLTLFIIFEKEKKNERPVLHFHFAHSKGFISTVTYSTLTFYSIHVLNVKFCW